MLRNPKKGNSLNAWDQFLEFPEFCGFYVASFLVTFYSRFSIFEVVKMAIFGDFWEKWGCHLAVKWPFCSVQCAGAIARERSEPKFGILPKPGHSLAVKLGVLGGFGSF